MIVVRRVRPRTHARRGSEVDSMLLTMLGASAASERNRRPLWRPPVEVFETEDTLEIVTEIAGMDAEDIDIVLEGDVLTIQGERKDPRANSYRSYHIARIGYGPFEVEIRLPFQVDAESAEAEYENGFLSVSLKRIKGVTIVPKRVISQSSTQESGE